MTFLTTNWKELERTGRNRKELEETAKNWKELEAGKNCMFNLKNCILPADQTFCRRPL
jgi:hypothetical protein